MRIKPETIPGKNARFSNLLNGEVSTNIEFMVELEIYAAGLRNPDKMMGLALELDTVSGLRYKVDTNHDIVYMEFSEEPLSLGDISSMFRKVGLSPRFVGVMPPEVVSKKKTQRIDLP